jgi:hypothetical protein
MELVEHGSPRGLLSWFASLFWFCFIFYIINRVHADDIWTSQYIERLYRSLEIGSLFVTFHLSMQRVIWTIQSSGVRYEWSFFSHNLCWQPALRYKRMGN